MGRLARPLPIGPTRRTMPEPTTTRPLDAAGVAGAVICCAIWGGNAVAAKYCIADDARCLRSAARPCDS